DLSRLSNTRHKTCRAGGARDGGGEPHRKKREYPGRLAGLRYSFIFLVFVLLSSRRIVLLSAVWKAVAANYYGYVIEASLVESEVDQRVACFARGFVLAERRGDRRIVNHIGESVGAQQESIVIRETPTTNLRVKRSSSRADRLGQHVFESKS